MHNKFFRLIVRLFSQRIESNLVIFFKQHALLLRADTICFVI